MDDHFILVPPDPEFEEFEKKYKKIGLDYKKQEKVYSNEIAKQAVLRDIIANDQELEELLEPISAIKNRSKPRC